MTKRGFTLLEVLIALAILASALAILMGTTASTSRQAVYAMDLTTASLLAKSKMIDVEYQLMADGFSDSDKTYSGDFRDEGRPDILWEATVRPVEIPEESKEQFLAQINSQLFGNQSEGALQGNAAFSAMLPTLIGQMPQMINNIGSKVRRVDLVVVYPVGGGMMPLKLMQYVSDPNTTEFNLFGEAEAPLDP